MKTCKGIKFHPDGSATVMFSEGNYKESKKYEADKIWEACTGSRDYIVTYGNAMIEVGHTLRPAYTPLTLAQALGRGGWSNVYNSIYNIPPRYRKYVVNKFVEILSDEKLVDFLAEGHRLKLVTVTEEGKFRLRNDLSDSEIKMLEMGAERGIRRRT